MTEGFVISHWQFKSTSILKISLKMVRLLNVQL